MGWVYRICELNNGSKLEFSLYIKGFVVAKSVLVVSLKKKHSVLFWFISIHNLVKSDFILLLLTEMLKI